MTKVFFDHLISYTEIYELLEISDSYERQELEEIIDGIFHHHILDLILTRLPIEHHIEFIELVARDPGHPGILLFVKAKVDIDIEAEIKKHGEKVKAEVLSEIKKTRTR